MPLRVCIADGHLLILSGIRTALQAADDIEVVGVTRSGAAVMALVDDKRPDLVLLDHRLPGVDGLTCLKRIRERHPETKVVMRSEDPQQISDALAAGASAYIGKRINPQDLPSAVRQVVAGVIYHQSALAGATEPHPPEAHGAGAGPGADLTERERTMLAAVSRGLSTKVISREFWISEKTVKFHLTNIYRKLGVHNRAGAMRYAFDHDLIPATPEAEAPLRDAG